MRIKKTFLDKQNYPGQNREGKKKGDTNVSAGPNVKNSNYKR
jgi:hypothetical protein